MLLICHLLILQINLYINYKRLLNAHLFVYHHPFGFMGHLDFCLHGKIPLDVISDENLHFLVLLCRLEFLWWSLKTHITVLFSSCM